MNEDIKNKLREYISKYRNYALVLNDWVKLKGKEYTTMDALEAVFNAANGKPIEMNNIITTLSNKTNTYGRKGHVYSDVQNNSVDIVNNNGKLTVIGYKCVFKEPQTNNISPLNPNIFRKKDNIAKKTYVKTKEEIGNITQFVRTYLNVSDDESVIANVKAIMNYAQKQKISYDKAMEKIKNNLSKKNTHESKKIIVGENALKIFEEIENEMTYYSFTSNVKSFLKDLLNNPSTAKPSLELMAKGLNRSKLLSYLINKGIIHRDEKIVDEDDNGNPKTAVMNVKFKVPKKNFERNMQKLYINLFEKNIPEKSPRYSKLSDDIAIMNASPLTIGVVGGANNLDGLASLLDKGIKNRNIPEKKGNVIVNDFNIDAIKDTKTPVVHEDGEGATNCSSSGQFSQPVFGVQKRKIYNPKPNEDVDEATTTMNSGDYQYTVPFPGDKSTLKRKNGKDGSISINTIK